MEKINLMAADKNRFKPVKTLIFASRFHAQIGYIKQSMVLL